MDPNKIIQFFLTLFLVLTVQLKAQEPSTKQYYDPNLKYALPVDSKVKMNWICPPLEDSIVKKASVYRFCFGVDLYKQPWMGYHNDVFLNPIKGYQFKISSRYENFTFLENGALLVATSRDLGYVVPPRDKYKGYDNKFIAEFQPIAALPIQNCNIYSGAGNCLFLSGHNDVTQKYEIYLLKPEKLSTGTSIKQYEKIFSGPESIAGIAGDSLNVYIASYRLVIKLNLKTGSITKLPVNAMNNGVRALAYSPQAGLFYTTDNGVGFIGQNSCIPFLACTEPEIFVRGGTLYVLFNKTMGVLSFDNIGDLKRFDITAEEVPATTTLDAKPTWVRFFEGPNPAPAFKDRKYVSTFGRDSTRFVYGEIYLDNLLYQKQPNKQLLEVSYSLPFGYYGGSQKMLFNYDLNTPTLVGTFPFGSGDMGTLYPGDYVVTTMLNNVKVDERSFNVTGKVTIIEAAAMNDSVRLREMIRNGADVNYKNVYGTTALMQTAIIGDLESTKMLIERGADVNARNTTGQSALLTACRRYEYNVPIIKLLLDHGADVNATDKDGETPLFKTLANLNEYPEITKMLIDKGANVNAKDAKGRTPITIISYYSNEKNSGINLDMLLKKGADPNAKKEDGKPFFNDVLLSKNYYCVRVLIENGVNPNLFDRGLSYDYKEQSVLMALLFNFAKSKDESEKKQILETVDLLCAKGGILTNEEEKKVLQRPGWKALPNKMIYEILERQDEAVETFETSDTTFQKLIIKRMMSIAYNEIVKATSVDDYQHAIDLCNKAKDRAEKFNLLSLIPEVYFDLGLLWIYSGNNENGSLYLKNYLEKAPDGPLASKAKSMIRKLD